MKNIFICNPDPKGGYVATNHAKYSVEKISPDRIHIPKGREGEVPLYNSLEDFLDMMGLDLLINHKFPKE